MLNIRLIAAIFLLLILLPLTVESIDLPEDFILEGDFEAATIEGPDYIQETPEFQRVLDNIIGSPDFESMRNLPKDSQDYILGEKVGWIVVPSRYTPGHYRICTGFLVGPDLFMTNHHCIHDDEGLLSLEKALIFMDYYQRTDVDPTRGRVTSGISTVLQADAPKDYALLRLDKPIGNIYGWLSLDTTGQFDSSQSVKLISHPAGRSKEIVRRNTEIVDPPAGHPLRNVPFSLAYLADSEGGSSGSPVFLKDGNQVIGINHSAWTENFKPTFNAGTLMSYIVPEIQHWLPIESVPDLSVSQPQLINDFVHPSESFSLSVSVTNQGTVSSEATTLHFYQSLDENITISDTEVGRINVNPLSPNGSIEASIVLNAPVSSGIYYYGACVDTSIQDPRTDNNCSIAATLTVSETDIRRMYWAQTPRFIKRANVNGSNIETLIDWVHGSNYPHTISLDMVNKKIYWIGNRGDLIRRANLDGSNIEDIISVEAFNLHLSGLVLDISGGMMYWYHRDDGIQRSNLDGSDIETVYPKQQFRPSIEIDAIDFTNGKIYWFAWSTDGRSIKRANLNGSNIEDIVTGLEGSGDIELDLINNKIYWTNSEDSKIQRANLDGSHIEDFVTGADGLLYPSGLALDIEEGKMYWSDFTAGIIQRANLDGSDIENLIVKDVDSVHSIALDIPQTHAIRPVQLSPTFIENQNLMAGTEVSLNMPIAHGGTPPYTYTLEPVLPSGLNFEPTTRLLSGTPETETPPTTFTYTTIDASNQSVSFSFTLLIEPAEEEEPNLDVNGDGEISVLDLVWVAMFYGRRGDNLSADVNQDKVVNVQDFIAVAEVVDEENLIEAAIWEAIADIINIEGVAGSPSFSNIYENVIQAFADTNSDLLYQLLSILSENEMIPEKTELLPNYPNPFNPETWIPYQLAQGSEVKISISSIDGKIIRILDMGYQPAGIFQTRDSAAYWDGRNEIGEKVSSGIYFYTLTAKDFSATRKMLILK